MKTGWSLAALLAVGLALGCGKAPPPATPVPPTPVCADCGRALGPGHDCLRVDYCMSCVRDIRRGHYCGQTTICTQGNALHPPCMNEVGIGHVHGLTHFCPNCDLEVGANHMVNEVGNCVTRYCARCGFDAVRPVHAETYRGQKLLHVCGVTHFCPKCLSEVASNHVCDKTRLCAVCRKDVSFPYCAKCGAVLGGTREARWDILRKIDEHKKESYHCAACDAEVEVRTHQCYATEFCPNCRIEKPLDHSDQE